MASSIVGLEITEEEVRAAEATTGRNPRILAHGTVRLPRGAAKDSEVLDRAAVVGALQQLWRQAGFKSRRVVLGICSRRVLVRDYRTQAMSPELLKQALPFQVADLLPVPADQAVIDFYPIAQEGEQLSGLLVAAVSETVTELVETLTQAKLHVEQVDLSPFGLLRAIGMLTDSAESVAIVHLGPHTSYVVVSVQGVPRFVRIIPLELGAAVPEPEGEEIAEGEHAGPTEEAGPLTAQELSRRSRPAVAAPLTPERIDELVTQIVNTLRFHLERSGGGSIAQVFLTGAGAGIAGVHPAFRERFSVPVHLVGGHHLAQSNVTSRHGQEDLELLTPVGLAMAEAR
ncbi:pilus assembly protein PilM [Leucobacter weissii]|uniref:Pilus assembly protein PilM n=1 Tax=Leucobacter weissii TaxID=1983706 RepID=A0A939MHN4_9MICO|nr:pilus assembly protein PilM [Leucobacter weissii]MBO1901113.1 pilus assembly protein PilM [Leucobacter weissii]